MNTPAIEVLRQAPAAAAVVLTAWLFLDAQASAETARDLQARTQTTAVLDALAANTAALRDSARALARVELVLDQLTPDDE